MTAQSGVRAYIRVSSKSQDHAMQKAAIVRACAARADTVAHWYTEKRSAKTLDRPGLAQLRQDAHAGLFSRLYLFRLDRLTRSGIRDTLAVVHELRAAGVEIISVTETLPLHGPMGDFVLAGMAFAAQMERVAIGERISAARERVEEEGGAWGRPRRLDDAGVARIRALRAEGRTIREIAVAVKVPRSTVSDALKPVSEKGGPNSGPSTPR